MTAPDPGAEWVARHNAEWAADVAENADRITAARAALDAHLAAAQARVLRLYADHATRGAA